jgi:hypothetical protein
MAVSRDGRLYADFGTAGLWRADPSLAWALLTALDPEEISARG